MSDISRRWLLSAGAATAGAAVLPPSIARAVAISPDVRTGTIKDVGHVVILMQENRGFDHYFGSLRGVRGFADRFPIPVAAEERSSSPSTVWRQKDRSAAGGPRMVSPFHLETRSNFDLMRMAGTPHSWPDAQLAWDQGRMAHWPEAKQQRAMGHYRREDIPFQFALAEAFTVCDAYHCSIQTGTNTNRLFLWSGCNDPAGEHGGPVLGNSHDRLPQDGGAKDSYRWTTVVERMQAAGVDWRIYQDMADNFTDNPLVGFDAFRRAHSGDGDPELKARALTTYRLDALKADVLGGRLPQVSYVIAPAAASEHPGPSSPAQGAAYTAEVLDALSADPTVWARTALFVMFDENDGFFDHAPPPAPPSRDGEGRALGGSTIDLANEYHLKPSTGDAAVDLPAFRGRPYGLGPRVPMYVVSPWSRGGWVNSQVFDHTSVIRFLETRFGFKEPNISVWRRTICGDLTSAFDFSRSDPAFATLPDPRSDARRAEAVKIQIKPGAPAENAILWQEPGIRPSRPLPYTLEVTELSQREGLRLRFTAEGAGAVLHVYDRLNLANPPRRYTLGAGHRLEDRWAFDASGAYDLWVLGPNGFHRGFAGNRRDATATSGISWTVADDVLSLRIPDHTAGIGLSITQLSITPTPATPSPLPPGKHRWPLSQTLGWYDVTLQCEGAPGFQRRLAGRFDVADRPTISDPFNPALSLI